MTTELQLIPADTQKLIEEALEYLGSITEITISNDAEYEATLEVCKTVKQRYNSLEAERKKLVKPLNDEIKEINNEFKVVTSKLDSFEKTSKQAASVYFNKQEQLRIEQQKKLEAEAAEQRRKAEEKARIEAEKVAKYEAEGRQKLADEARAREEAAQAKAVQTVAPVIETKKPSGASFRKVWKIREENTDIKKAVEYCAANEQFKGFLIIDYKKLEKLCNATKGMVKVPGVDYYEDTITAVRT